MLLLIPAALVTFAARVDPAGLFNSAIVLKILILSELEYQQIG